MPVRSSESDQSHDKTHEDNVKLLIALRRALGTDAKNADACTSRRRENFTSVIRDSTQPA